MLDAQNPTGSEKDAGLRRYLPERLWSRGAGRDPVQHLDQVLHTVRTYLPRVVAQARLADPSAPAVSGSFTRATLLFVDISGFTAMSERLTQLGREGAEVITGIVNEYFAAMLDIIAQHGGDLFKFGGDALLVCFSGDGAAARGCWAALEMQEAMERFAVIHTAQGAFHLRMKAALGTGGLVLVSLGSPDRLEFAVMGPAVEQVARAEDLAEAGEVVVDQATREAVGAGIVTGERAPGFYHLTALTSMPSPQQAAPPVPASADAHQLASWLDALSPYLPSEVLDRIVADPGQRMIEGEHRLVTVLFANFYGINAIIEALGADRADELTAILNRHFIAMRDVIHKYGGIVNKVDSYAVGYRIMALFGAPVAHEDDPARAVHAALEMQEAMAAFTDLETSAGRFALKQRIGVNTGHVFAGNLGSALRREYSVMGDEVNLTSRLMGVAAEGQVLVSQSTARRVEGLFELRERDLVKVKGKREPVRNYRVHSTIDQVEQADARSDFLGRQEELELARGLVDVALAGSGALLGVSGDPGVGKSRLIAELSAYARVRGMATLRGEAVSYGRSLPYLPWIRVLRALLGLEDDDASPGQRRDRLVAGLGQAGLEDWTPVVGTVLGVDVAETPLTASLDAQLRQQRFFDVVLELLQRRAADAPLLLVLDNMQWADAISLDLGTYVARNVGSAPLLFVLAHRPDLDPLPWSDIEGYQSLHLEELDDETSLALARSVLGTVGLSPSLQRLILDRAQGNPLFVEEVGRALSESGVIQIGTDEAGDRIWTIAGDGASVEVPTTLTALIMSRIDRLETISRHLLQVAAVIGVTFRSPVLDRVYLREDLEDTLLNRLTELAQIDLFSFSPPDEYTFTHTLTQEVAYESLSFARRRELHVRVGEDIERSHVGDLTEHYGVLARHFERGHVYDKAFTYLVGAGNRARLEFANEAALDDYGRALQIADEQSPPLPDLQTQVLDVLEAAGDIHNLIGRYAEAVERFRQVIVHPLCPSRRQGDLLRKIAKAHELQGQYDEALDHLAEGQRVLLAEGQDRHSAEMARIFALSSWVRMRRGEMEQAVVDCERGLAILAELPRDEEHLRDEAELYNTLGAIYVGQGSYAAAAEAYQRSTNLREQAGDLPGLARSYNNLARTAWSQGDLEQAGDYLRRSVEISRQIGNNYVLAFGYNNLGVVSYTTGDAEQALEYYRQALSLRQRIGDSYGAAQTHTNMGEALVSLERYAEARRFLEQAASGFESLQNKSDLPDVYCLLARVELAQADTASALEHAGHARRIAASINNLEWQGIAERILARGYSSTGDVAQARRLFQSSIALLSQAENQVELAHSHYELGLMLVEQADRESARDHLEQAADLFASAGAEKEAEQARTRLIQLYPG